MSELHHIFTNNHETFAWVESKQKIVTHNHLERCEPQDNITQTIHFHLESTV